MAEFEYLKPDLEASTREVGMAMQYLREIPEGFSHQVPVLLRAGLAVLRLGDAGRGYDFIIDAIDDSVIRLTDQTPTAFWDPEDRKIRYRQAKAA